MNFGEALQYMKVGRRVARVGWNGKGMWLRLVDGAHYGIDRRGIDLPENLRLLPWIGMRTADAGFVPWLASQTDILAEDWEIAAP